MKKMFLVIAIAASLFASAQGSRDTFYFKHFQPKPQINSNEQPKTYSFNYPVSVLDQAKLQYTLPNGNKVYALPQDHMPCVVPDMSQYGNIPTAKPNVPLNAIPNPAYPSPSKPGVITQEQLQKLLEKYKKPN